MPEIKEIEKLAEKVDKLHALAQELHDDYDHFPAINRNAKRILAAAYMMKLNTEQPEQ
jgi:hypothetical protein